ncbi:MAG: methylthioribulose 1-phosphate dehydratase [Acidobacteriota bacterium]|nr:methylthioribulose 1-phosphate dehydratase [Acidobacteriota bacterium]
MHNQILDNPTFKETATNLAQAVRFLAERGWTPATSSNFSARLPFPNRIAISRSGIDKYTFGSEHVMVVDNAGEAVAPADARPSAETLLHTLLYKWDQSIGAVLHTHSLHGTVLSIEAGDALRISGFEILKGLAGNITHDMTEVVPILPNSQDMTELAAQVSERLKPETHGFLIAGHGLYTWGKTIADARRHVETFEFLFDCLMNMKR